MGKDPALGAVSASIAGLSLAAACALPPLIPRKDPLTAREHRALAESYEARGLKEEAGEHYQAAVERDPADADAWIAMGNAAAGDAQWEKAAGFYRRALTASPRSVGASNNLAFAYMSLGRLKEAESLAREALARGGPMRPYVLDTLAQLYLRQGRLREAREALDQADLAAPSTDAVVREQLLKTRQQLSSTAPPAARRASLQ
jgi:tetratricopeptide (TPR) repeat protein